MFLCKCSRQFTTNRGRNRHQKLCKIDSKDFEKIKQLYRDDGKSIKDLINLGFQIYTIIAAIKGIVRDKKEFICSKCSNKFTTAKGRKYHEHFCNVDDTKIDTKIEKIRKLYKSGLSIFEINQKGFKRTNILYALKGITRTYSEANKLARKKYPTKWTVQQKKNQSERLKELHRQKRANTWNRHSYANDIFEKFLIEKGFKTNFDFYREFPFSVYRADFYFPKLALVIEIDGSQHYRIQHRIINDKRKDQYLKNIKIDVLRIPWLSIEENKLAFERANNILKNKENRELVIQEFSVTQLKLLNKFQELQKIIFEKKKQKQEEKQKIKLHRLELLKTIDIIKYGWIVKVCKLWNVSHSTVKKYMKSHFADELLKAYTRVARFLDSRP